MILINPGYRPSPTLPVFPPIKKERPEPQYQIDREIVEVLRAAPEPLSSWQIVNTVAATYGALNRTESRALRLRVLSRIRPVARAGFARRIGPYFSLA